MALWAHTAGGALVDGFPIVYESEAHEESAGTAIISDGAGGVWIAGSVNDEQAMALWRYTHSCAE